MSKFGFSLVRRSATLVTLAAAVALLTAGATFGALVNGALPAGSFTYASTIDNSVDIAGSGIDAVDIANLQRYVDKLVAIAHPTTAQQTALTRYQARLAEYQARYAVAVDVRAAKATNVKTTYSRVPPALTFESGWHYHNGAVVVTVTNGTLTLFDAKCTSIDVIAGHTYIESPGQVLNAKALPAKNTGVDNVEWFTSRLYSSGAIDPVPVPAPCTP